MTRDLLDEIKNNLPMTDRKNATPEVKSPVGTLDLRNQFPPETLRELFVRLGVPPSKEFEPVLDQTYQFAGVEYGPMVGEDGQPVVIVKPCLEGKSVSTAKAETDRVPDTKEKP